MPHPLTPDAAQALAARVWDRQAPSTRWLEGPPHQEGDRMPLLRVTIAVALAGLRPYRPPATHPRPVALGLLLGLLLLVLALCGHQ
jgi:hypothetical protein